MLRFLLQNGSGENAIIRLLQIGTDHIDGHGFHAIGTQIITAIPDLSLIHI